MDICFDSLHDSTRDAFYDVEYVEVAWAKVNGRMTRFYHITTKDGKTRAIKYKDHQLYWIRN